MSFIEEISPETAQGPLADLYETIAGARGGVAKVMTVHSLNPAAMRSHFEFYKTIMFGRGSLRRPIREMIGVVVSSANKCAYCVAHHGEPLKAYRIDPTLIERLGAGELPAALLDERTLLLLAYAHRLTVDPQRDEAAIEALREVGWSDAEILDTTLIAGYFNFVNRVVQGLGVELEDGFEETCKAEIDP